MVFIFSICNFCFRVVREVEIVGRGVGIGMGALDDIKGIVEVFVGFKLFVICEILVFLIRVLLFVE